MSRAWIVEHQAPVSRRAEIAEARRILSTKYRELQQGKRIILPAPLRNALYDHLRGAFERYEIQVAQGFAHYGTERGNKALGEALAGLQCIYAEAMRKYQERMDALVAGGLSEFVVDSPSAPESDEHAPPPQEVDRGRVRKRGGGL